MNIKMLQSEILQFIHPSHLQKCSFVFLYDLQQHCTGWYLQEWPFLKSFRWNGSRKKQLEGFRRGGGYGQKISNYTMYLSRIWLRKREGEKGKQLSVGETGTLITEVGPLVSTKEPNFLTFPAAQIAAPIPALFGKASEIFGAPNLIISMCNKLDGQQRPLFAPDTTKK